MTSMLQLFEVFALSAFWYKMLNFNVLKGGGVVSSVREKLLPLSSHEMLKRLERSSVMLTIKKLVGIRETWAFWMSESGNYQDLGRSSSWTS